MPTLTEKFALLPRMADPRPLYEELQTTAPVFWTPGEFWYVTPYDLANEVLRDSELWKHRRPGHEPPSEDLPYALRIWRSQVAAMDAPDHTRLRRLAAPMFTPRAVERRADRVAAIFDGLLDSMEASLGADRTFDVSALAAPYPTLATLDLLGISADRVDVFTAVGPAISTVNEPDPSGAELARCDGVFAAAADVVGEEVEARRLEPRDDLLTGLVQAGDDGDRLTMNELTAMIVILVAGGQETAANTLCSALYHLLLRPEVLAEVRADRSLVPAAIEETLRFEPATRGTIARYAAVDTELGGQRILRGQQIWVSLHAANHDPAVFADPLTFDIHREQNRHLGFAAGAHFCMGAAIARLALRTAMNLMLDRYPTIELAEPEVAWKESFVLRALEALPLRVLT